MPPGISLHLGDCLDFLRALPGASIDAVVTDPPAGIGFMGKAWDGDKGGRDLWVAWLAERLAECLRAAKPGARMLCWAIPRTSHWTATAIEDAGWIVEDRVSHIFGQGFPKARSKLKPAVEDWWLARKPSKGVPPLNIDACRVTIEGPVDPKRQRYHRPGNGIARGAVYGDGTKGGFVSDNPHPDSPRHNAAGRWPAHLCLSHHPDCREAGTKRVRGSHSVGNPRDGLHPGLWGNGTAHKPHDYTDADGLEAVAAWECAEGCPVAMLDAQSGFSASRAGKPRGSAKPGDGWGMTKAGAEHDDFGGASRFFYCPKAPKSDRGEGNAHPTVKHTTLMRWLIRLITPPGGVVLDPFMGSGTTLVSAIAEGFAAIGCESDPESYATADRRVAAARAELPLFSAADRNAAGGTDSY